MSSDGESIAKKGISGIGLPDGSPEGEKRHLPMSDVRLLSVGSANRTFPENFA